MGKKIMVIFYSKAMHISIKRIPCTLEKLTVYCNLLLNVFLY